MRPLCRLRRASPLFTVWLLLAGATRAADMAEPCSPETAQSAVTRAFEGLVRARSARDPDAVMSFFAKDALLSYPGHPDSGFDAIREVFRKSYSHPDLRGRYSAGIEEVQVSGDLAFVRAVWTADLEQISTGRKVRTQDKDLEIWRCQPDGSWKLYRGLSYPVESPSAPGP
jgi:uncharacterized protein (TIGR02246 family)